MSLDKEHTRRELEQALNALAQTQGDDLVRQIRPILLANLDRGRIERATEGIPDRIYEYVRRVAQTFVSLHPYLHQLQGQQSQTVWEPLFQRMRTWAYNYFLRKNFPADGQTLDIANECATEAARRLLEAHFPYDTDFDPWAHVIVLNTCRKYIRTVSRKSVVPEDNKIELSDDLVQPNEILLEAQMLRTEGNQELEAALLQLTETRRRVIHMLYFDGMKPEEIAQKLGKSVGAIYSLHFHALEDLRKILSTIGYMLNE